MVKRLASGHSRVSATMHDEARPPHGMYNVRIPIPGSWRSCLIHVVI